MAYFEEFKKTEKGAGMKKMRKTPFKKNVTVCFFGTYDRNFTSNKIIYNGLIKNGAEVVVVNSHTPVTRLDSEKDASIFQILRRILRKYKIFVEISKNIKGIKKSDAIYVGYPGHVDVVLGFILAKIFNKKLVFNPLVIIYTGLTEEQRIIKKGSLVANIIKFGESLIYKSCDLVLADTPFQKEHLNKEFGVGKDKIRVLPIGADDKVYPFAPKVGNDPNFNVVYYGLFSPIHGVEYLIKAAKLLEKQKDIKFLLVGNGNTFQKDFDLAKKLKVKNVIFYKDLTEKDAFDTLRKADVFLGFLADHPVGKRVVPNKVYQGLALGKTVLTAYSPAIEGVLTDKKNVYLCKADNPVSVSEAILDLRNNPGKNKSISKNGHKLFIDSFTPKSIGRDLIKYLREVI